MDNDYLPSLALPLEVIPGRFGEKVRTYVTQVRVRDIESLLGHDPRPENWKNLPADVRTLYDEIQRRTAGPRRRNIVDYLDQRFSRRQIAGFPAVSIGVTKPLVFSRFDNGSSCGRVFLSNDDRRVVLDGLGRLTGLLDMSKDEDTARFQTFLSHTTIAVELFVPNENETFAIGDLSQLFSDFNFKVFPVPARLAMAQDVSDIYLQLTNQLAKQPAIDDCGGMEIKSASLGKKSTALVVQQVLSRVVRGATEGRKYQEDNKSLPPSPTLSDASFQTELAQLGDYFQRIRARMGDARWTNRESLHLSAPGWQALGVLYHDLYHRGLPLNAEQRQRMIDTIADVDWSRYSEDWVGAGLGVWAAPKEGDKMQVVIRGAGRSNTQAIINRLRVATGLDSLLVADESDGEPAEGPEAV